MKPNILDIVNVILFLPIIIYLILYYQYHYSDKKIKLYKQLNIKKLDYIDFEYLNKNYSEEDIYITKTSCWPHIHRKTKLKDYLNTYIKDPNWYFATEDESGINGLERNISDLFGDVSDD